MHDAFTLEKQDSSHESLAWSVIIMVLQLHILYGFHIIFGSLFFLETIIHKVLLFLETIIHKVC